MKTKTLYLYENEMPTTSLFREAIEDPLGRFFDVRKIKCIKTVSSRDLDEYDVFVFIRPQGVLPYRLAKCARKKGRFVITYCDDDLYALNSRARLDKYRTKYFRKTLSVSDIVYSSSPRIANKYKDYTVTKRMAVGDTTVNPQDIIPHRLGNSKVKIVYAAGVSHGVLFETYVYPIINKLFDAVGNVFSLTFVGVHPHIPDVNPEIEINYVPMMSLEKYREYMNAENFDIGLAPIHDNEFSKCKYFNKFFEYTLSGTVGIYSNIEPYTYVIRDGVNGYLASTDPESWYEKLKDVIIDANDRQKCLIESQRLVAECFNRDANESKELEQIPELENCNVAHTQIVSIITWNIWKTEYFIIQFLNYLVTVFEHFRQQGLKSLIKKIRDHLFQKSVYR